MKHKKIVKCMMVWSLEPLLILGKKYKVIRRYFFNGEEYYKLKNSYGTVFEVPSIFLVNL